MDRLAEQVVAWHNSHPLAKRISIYDVHTIGVVALPFMRSGRGTGAGAAAGPIEPVLTDSVSTESLAAWHEESTIAANPNGAELDALADQEEVASRPSQSPLKRVLRRLRRLLRIGVSDYGLTQIWPAFSERFVDGLSPRRIAAFARNHGYATRPGDETWPQRVVAMDDQMMSNGGPAGASGAWPFELYVMSAAIDAGNSRSRVLVGRGGFKPPIIGRRCADPKRVGIFVLVLLALLAVPAMLWWPRSGDSQGKGPAAAASAASSVSAAPAALAGTGSAASMPAVASSAPEAPASAASALAMAASAPAASAPATAASEAAASAPAITDIRPRFVEPARPPGHKEAPLHGGVPAKAEAPAPATATPAAAASLPANARAASAAAPPKPEAELAATDFPMARLKPDIKAAAMAGTPVVALVAPPMRDKAQAQAMLSKLRELVAPMQADPSLLQAELFSSPEGWRPAVWPFASRAEAQLINATLIARGLKTKAVNF